MRLPELPDVLLASGAVCYVIGTWQYSPALALMLVGAACVVAAFEISASRSRGASATRETAHETTVFTLDNR